MGGGGGVRGGGEGLRCSVAELKLFNFGSGSGSTSFLFLAPTPASAPFSALYCLFKNLPTITVVTKEIFLSGGTLVAMSFFLFILQSNFNQYLINS